MFRDAYARLAPSNEFQAGRRCYWFVSKPLSTAPLAVRYTTADGSGRPWLPTLTTYTLLVTVAMTTLVALAVIVEMF